MKYFVSWFIPNYGGDGDEVFDTKEAMLAWVNERVAENADFKIESVIEGRLIELEPVQVVTQFKVK